MESKIKKKKIQPKIVPSYDMNKSFSLRKEDKSPSWRLIDADGQVLGRLATKLADVLRGKDKSFYTSHTDCGDYIVVINAEKIVLTGNKMENKEYIRNTGWIGGKKVATAKELMQKHPTKIIELAVKRMLPKNRLSRQIFKKLKVYAGSEHPHKAQLGKI